jgi:hypothetical protein
MMRISMSFARLSILDQPTRHTRVPRFDVALLQMCHQTKLLNVL